MLARIDDFLMVRAQKFCDTTYATVGITKYRISKWALILYNVYTIMLGIMSGFVQALWTTPSPQHLLLLLPLALWLYVVYVIDRDEVHFLKHGTMRGKSERFCNYDLRLVSCRFFGSFTVLELVIGHLDGIIQNMLFLLFVYTGACVPRPPSKSKGRELYEKSLMWLRGKLTKQPVPQPS